MILSIITINRNNAEGLQKTMQSVVDQTFDQFEYIVVDGASTDTSVDIIRSFEKHRPIKWVSEPDNGIYNGMNKGIRMASGDYIMILNSGDYLAGPNVIEQMSQAISEAHFPAIFYGNIIKIWPNGKTIVDHQIQGNITMYDFYSGTLNPDGTYIRRSLFDQYGFFDETMKICSDWAWMLNSIALHGEKPVHTNVNSIYFDMTGVSESGSKSQKTILRERRQVLEATLMPSILADYDRYGADIRMMRRIHRHKWAYKIVHFIERILFKLEKKSK